MNKVIVDDVLRSKLFDLTRPIVFCDGEGRELGRFVPSPAAAQPPLTEDELQRRELERHYTTAEVLARLEES